MVSSASLINAQQTKTAPSPDQQWQAELAQHPEVWIEFGNLVEKLQASVKLPPARSESRLMSLAPKSTVFYAAMPNYGDAAMQALNIFRQQLKQSPTLRQWWTSGDMAKTGPQVEDAVEKFYRISQYLGDEMAVSATSDGETPNVLMFAEIRKPGLKQALQQTIAELTATAKTKPDIRVLDVNELAGLPAEKGRQQLLVLVRPDYLVISPDASTLRSFNARLDAGTRDFATTPFGRRIAQAYRDNVTVVGACDLQTIIAKARASSTSTPKDARTMATAEQSGFADAQYLVWEHASSGGRDLSQTELSFTGPRHGMAAWLAPPSPLGSLDFVSPKAMTAMSIVLENPAQIFDDVRNMATAMNPNAFAGVAQMERQMNISLRDDLLRPLGGELTVELDSITPAPIWKALLKVNDPARLQQTIDKLLATAPFRPEEFVSGGATFHKIPLGEGPQAMEIAYGFVDNYLLIASNPATAIDAARLHRSGLSLAKSKRFLDSLPPGRPAAFSALMFQDANAMAAMQMRRLSPELAGALEQMSGQDSPAVMAAYAEPNSIKGASTSATMDAGVVLVAAAVAIPNLLRARVAANEAGAVGSLRTLNVAQVTYASTYPEHGYARTLAALGGAGASAQHAGLVDAKLGCGDPSGCEKDGYRFRLYSVCLEGQCAQYTIVATPINPNTGTRNFCSTPDGVIRFQAGPPVTTPVRVSECRRWTPLQ